LCGHVKKKKKNLTSFAAINCSTLFFSYIALKEIHPSFAYVPRNFTAGLLDFHFCFTLWFTAINQIVSC
jgi:hypothetical protein